MVQFVDKKPVKGINIWKEKGDSLNPRNPVKEEYINY